MSYIYLLIILNYCFLLLELSKQEIINNLIISNKEFNEINYILILQNDTVKTASSQSLAIKKDFIKLFYQSYIFTDTLFLCKDESNNFILVVKDKYYSIKLSSENEIQKVISQKSLNSKYKYLGYITCSKSKSTTLSLRTYLYPLYKFIILFSLSLFSFVLLLLLTISFMLSISS